MKRPLSPNMNTANNSLTPHSSLVEPLTIAQQNAAAKVLGQAFAQDSFMAYVLPHSATRIQQLSQIFFPLVYFSQRHGKVVATPDGGGVLAWVAGEFFPNTANLLDIFRSGALGLPLSLGPAAFKRLTDHDDVCEQALLRHASQNFAYLWAVGVCPDRAGQGLGKKMIHAALEQMYQQGYSTCWLRTENPKNVGLYEYLGFQQAHTEVPSASGQQYWLMFQHLQEALVRFPENYDAATGFKKQSSAVFFLGDKFID